MMRASRAGHWNDAAPAGFAGGLAGVFVAAFLSALIKSVESLLGPWSTSIVAVILLWPLLGAGIALALIARPASSQLTAHPGAHAMTDPLVARRPVPDQLLGRNHGVPTLQAADDRENPTDAEVARAIERGLDFLKRSQGDDGSWQFHFMHEHQLGMTALAGLALLENGVPADDPAVAGARKAVENLSIRSNQTYDLALAILFLSREGSIRRGVRDERLSLLAARLAGGSHGGIWNYTVPMEVDGSRRTSSLENRGPRRTKGRRRIEPEGEGDNSNTQFALLGLWAAGRHEFDADPALEAIDSHFRSTQQSDGRWSYRMGREGSPAMSCAGLMGLAIAAARPSLAERQTARSRGAALAADPVFQAALQAVTDDAKEINDGSDIYYLWSLERVCVALGLRTLGGFDWYARGAKILLGQQHRDGSWPRGQWGVYPNTCLALLFLRKANLAFELDRVLRLPGPAIALATARQEGPEAEQGPDRAEPPSEPASTQDPGGESAREQSRRHRREPAGVSPHRGPV